MSEGMYVETLQLANKQMAGTIDTLRREVARLTAELTALREAARLTLPILRADVWDMDAEGVCFYCHEVIDSGDEHKADCKQLVAYLAVKAALPTPPEGEA